MFLGALHHRMECAFLVPQFFCEDEDASQFTARVRFIDFLSIDYAGTVARPGPGMRFKMFAVFQQRGAELRLIYKGAPEQNMDHQDLYQRA